ncbi:IPT/TIG domain-containing protein [Mucilaginibacter flavidus]|uniref:IPT/TIG domain-containing protein n=1 Tax=Mucilaginibacter flavidus TaxID=2949309 RepID=UPI002093867F|nr:IPT/TIG domain-containing protein [Mucilaginibacter flavidus]MCO5947644.1 IPT/TIG domain-containing protein [Mucilaginibacter flavidus]
MKKIINYSFILILTVVSIFVGCKKNNPVPVPAITAISPSTGLAGIAVTISGSGFNATASANTVKFNGAAAVVTSASSGSLVVTAPAGGSTGTVIVTTTGGTATGPIFTYLMAPSITAINPASGKAGSVVTITGVNFDAVPANNIVKFNGTTTAITSGTTTSLVVTAPAGGSSGAVTVTTPGGTATGPIFTYLQAPTIIGITPASATAGTPVTITGTNFDATVANNAVSFNGTAAVVTSATVTQLVVTVPTGGTSGNVTVITPGGTSNAFGFTYATAGPNIYVLGSDTRSGFGYWKNFVFTPVADWLNPYSMVGSGNDIYVAGPSTSGTPTYWKNGAAVQLSAQTGFTFSIYVSGADVYCLGAIGTTYYTWKNGTSTALNTNSVTVIGSNASSYLNNAIAVSNGDVYVAGSRYLAGTTTLKATYWKNGTPVDLTDGVHAGSAKASAVFISGSDVYVAGTEEVRDPVTGGIINQAPRLWKNGVSISITTPANSLFNRVSSILVKGADVYIGGQYNGAGAVWKNGTLINTSTYALAENVSSIFLYNNTDIYVTGASSSSGNNCYWKNGNFVEMDPGCNVVSSSCARTSANQVVAIYVK